VRKLHIAHHYDRADTVEFDYRSALKAAPAILRGCVLALEWAFCPAVEMLMHVRSAVAPFLNRSLPLAAERRLMSAIGTPVALAFWAFLVARSGMMALCLYFLSTAVFLQILSVHDAFQHTYTVLLPNADGTYVTGPGPRTPAYEEENTYSPLISESWPLVNALTLNFGMHNAHHRKPMTPWYKLPALHREMYAKSGGTSAQVLPMTELWGTYIRNRLRRVLEEDYGVVAKAGSDRARAFVGSLGVSFLTV